MIDLYLASPYSHHSAEVREHRFHEACRAAAWLMAKGLVVFSPIAYGHSMSQACGLPGHWDFWQRVDHAFIDSSRAVIVLMLPGWISSNGVQAEILYSCQKCKPVWWLRPAGDGFQVFRECPSHPLLLAA